MWLLPQFTQGLSFPEGCDQVANVTVRQLFRVQSSISSKSIGSQYLIVSLIYSENLQFNYLCVA